MKDSRSLLAAHDAVDAAFFVDQKFRATLQRQALDAATYARSALLYYLEDRTGVFIRDMMVMNVANADWHFEYLALLRRSLDLYTADDPGRQVCATWVCILAGMLPEDDPNAGGTCRADGFTHLMAACASGRGGADVAMLVAAGADPRATIACGSNQGYTALHYGARAGNTSALAGLFDSIPEMSRPDPNLATVGGLTPLYLAARGGWVQTVALLITRRAIVNAEIIDGSTPLIAAAETGRAATVAELLSAKADVNKEKEDGVNALSMAAQMGYSDVISALLAGKADVNRKSGDHTPLLKAALTGQSEAIAMLLAARADVDKAVDGGLTPLCVSASSGHSAAVAALLAGKANIDRIAVNGMTALMLSAWNGKMEVVKVLCDARANVERSSPFGTALMCAETKRHVEVAQYLRERMAA